MKFDEHFLAHVLGPGAWPSIFDICAWYMYLHLVHCVRSFPATKVPASLFFTRARCCTLYVHIHGYEYPQHARGLRSDKLSGELSVARFGVAFNGKTMHDQFLSGKSYGCCQISYTHAADHRSPLLQNLNISGQTLSVICVSLLGLAVGSRALWNTYSSTYWNGCLPCYIDGSRTICIYQNS